MLLRVIYTDGSFDIVDKFQLQALIESHSISKFKRTDGWVEVGSPLVRRQQSKREYTGPERRGL